MKPLPPLRERCEYLVGDALYRLACPKCGRKIEWVFEPDADSPAWHGDCHACEKAFRCSVTKVTCTENES